MKQNKWLILTALIALVVGLLAFTPAQAASPQLPPIQTPDGDKVVLGDNYTLDEGESLSGNLIVLGGNADLREGSTVHGDVVVMGGNLEADGRIEGDVNVVGGLVTLGSSAVVEGDVNTMTSNLLQDEGAEIHGDINTNTRFPFFFTPPASIPIPPVPGTVPVTPHTPRPNAFDMGLNLIGGFLWWLGRSFVWAFLALLALLFWPRPVQRISEAAMANPAPSGGLGLLTAIVAPLVLALIALTICGIPITLVGLLVLAIGWALGIIALGLETGARLERLVHQDWAPPVQAAIGTFFLTMVANGIGAIVPCVGWMVPFLIGVIGLGAVLLTRFGTQSYPPAAGTAVVGGPTVYPTGGPAPAGPYTPTGGAPTTGYDPGAQVYDVSSDGEDLPPTF